MLRAVIFDMDGLLIDSEPLWVRAEIEVFGSVGCTLVENDCAQTKGLRVDDVVAYWHDRHGFDGCPPADVEARLVARVVELILAEGRALPGIDAALAAARSATGRKIALASSSPMPIIEAALQRLGLARTFDVVRSAEVESCGKPHPAIFLSTAKHLGVSPLDCVVIEDSMTGVIAAKAARMGCVAIPSDVPANPPGPQRDARFVLADAIVTTLADVTSPLLERVAGDR